MACVNYEQLREKFELELKRWLYFVSQDKSGLLRTSGINYKELASETLVRMNTNRRQMFTHQHLCAECNRTDAPIPPKTKSTMAGSDN